MPNVKQVSNGGNVTYYINEEAGVVVAKIECMHREPDEIVESISWKLRRSDSRMEGINTYLAGDNSRYELRPYYTGVAKCSPDDTFDIEVGKRIALARAQIKYHEALGDILLDIAESVSVFVQTIADRASREYDMVDKYIAGASKTIAGTYEGGEAK